MCTRKYQNKNKKVMNNIVGFALFNFRQYELSYSYTYSRNNITQLQQKGTRMSCVVN